MIFKYFAGDPDRITSKIGVLGKSFDAIGVRYKEVMSEISLTNDRTISGIISAWEKTGKKKKLSDKFIVTKADAQSELKDINSYDGFDEVKASELLTTLQKTQKKVKQGKSSWDEYYKSIEDFPEMQWQKEFIQTTDLQTASTEDVIKAQKAARQAAIDHNNGLKEMTIGAKAATVATKALAIAGNMLAMWAISAAIQAAVTAWDNYVHRVEKAAEKAKEAAQKNEELK